MENWPSSDQNITLERVAALRQVLAGLYTVEDMQMNQPKRGAVLFRGEFLCDLADCFVELRRRFETLGYTPMLREHDGDVFLLALPGVLEPKQTDWRINVLLFVLTFLSTMFVAAAGEEGFTGYQLWLGLPFSLSIMLILLAHEFGHYFAARYHGVRASLPFFIPLPIPPIGTLGAVILQREPARNRRVLLDIGAAGPLAGMLFAIPILMIGLATSTVEALPTNVAYMLEGNSILYAGIKYLIFQQVLPNGQIDVFLNQMAWAGWVGFLVTGLNLLPVAQLDGGHIMYVLLGKHTSKLFWPILLGVAGISFFIAGSFQYVLFFLLILWVGNRHAVPLDDVTPLDTKRKLIAIICLILFLLVFVPAPLTLIQP